MSTLDLSVQLQHDNIVHLGVGKIEGVCMKKRLQEKEWKKGT